MIKHELIGKTIEVISSKNQKLKGKKGKVVWETKNTITILNNSDKNKLIKSQIIFTLNQRVIDGKKIQKKPEDRLK
jgi:RNase P/RNase MRP subunit p29